MGVKHLEETNVEPVDRKIRMRDMPAAVKKFVSVYIK